MRIYRFVSAAVGSVLMASVSAAAFAGCGGFNGNVSACPSIINYPGAPDTLAPINSYNTNPYGYLKTFEYKNTPNINTMRIRSIGNCGTNGSATCNSGAPLPRPVMQRPMIAAPLMAAPAPRPVYRAPVMAAPRITASYNANRVPRQYGSTALVRGIAHIPTSIVDRSPVTHIDGVPQQQVNSVTTTTGHYAANSSTSMMSAPAYTPRPVIAAPIAPRPMAPRPIMAPRTGGNVIGHVNGGSYTYQAPGGGQYWEKTSGPTVVDGMLATKVLCRRSAPQPAPVRVNVVRPVIGVPTPVPTAVPMQARPRCAPTPFARPSGFGAQLAGGNSRYGNRWTG